MVNNSEKSCVVSLPFALVYAKNLDQSVQFYKKHFQFEPDLNIKMSSPNEVYGQMGKVGLWIGAGYETSSMTPRSTRATAMLGVDSASEVFHRLKTAGVQIIQNAPQEMGGDQYWFQFSDVDGNIWDVLGGH